MERLGSTRLQVVTLVAALVVSNDPIVHNALYELNTVEHLLVSSHISLSYKLLNLQIQMIMKNITMAVQDRNDWRTAVNAYMETWLWWF